MYQCRSCAKPSQSAHRFAL
jgi:hypothetical protein